MDKPTIQTSTVTINAAEFARTQVLQTQEVQLGTTASYTIQDVVGDSPITLRQ